MSQFPNPPKLHACPNLAQRLCPGTRSSSSQPSAPNYSPHYPAAPPHTPAVAHPASATAPPRSKKQHPPIPSPRYSQAAQAYALHSAQQAWASVSALAPARPRLHPAPHTQVVAPDPDPPHHQHYSLASRSPSPSPSPALASLSCVRT